jgi:hypothetical protein
VPFGNELGEITIAEAVIVSANVFEAVPAVGACESCTSTMIFVKVPAVVGIPEMAPWLLLVVSANPAGSGLEAVSRLKV